MCMFYNYNYMFYNYIEICVYNNMQFVQILEWTICEYFLKAECEYIPYTA